MARMKSPWILLTLVVILGGCQSSLRLRDAGSSTAGGGLQPTSQQPRMQPLAPPPSGVTAATAPGDSSSANSRLPPTGTTIQLTAARQPLAPSRPMRRHVPAPGSPPTLPAPGARAAEPIRAAEGNVSLTLGDALAISLAENPDLITIRGTENVGAAAVGVAGVYPWNPFVQAQYLPNGHPFTAGSPGNAVGQSSYYVWAMQRFELAHQRQYREGSAVAALGQIRWNIQQAELLNVAQTERLYFTAVYQRQLLNLAADAETLSQRLAGIIERQFKAGLATSVQRINAQIALRQLRRQRELADAGYQAALLALRQQLGMAISKPLDVNGNLTDYAWFSVSEAACRMSGTSPESPETLAHRMADARPDVMALRSAIAMAQENLNLARAARVPDVQAGPIYNTADDGTQYLGLRLQRDFAVFNNGSALARQRMTEVQQQRLAYEQLNRRAANEAAAAIDRYERARNWRPARPASRPRFRRPSWSRCSRSSRPAMPRSSTWWRCRTTCCRRCGRTSIC